MSRHRCLGGVGEWKTKNVLVNGCSDVGFQKTQWTNTSRWHCTPNHHRLWKLNTGLHAIWAMSFSTLPPDSRTLVSKWNTKLALIWKEDFGPLVNSPVLLLLIPGKTLTTMLSLLYRSEPLKPLNHISRIRKQLNNNKSAITSYLDGCDQKIQDPCPGVRAHSVRSGLLRARSELYSGSDNRLS